VVVEPIAVRPVASRLLEPPEPPKCDLPARPDYAPGEVIAYAECWRAAYDSLFKKHKGLAYAVIVRQNATAKAARAAKAS